MGRHSCIRSKHYRYLSGRYCGVRIDERETVPTPWHTAPGSRAGFARQRGGLATSSNQRFDRCLCSVPLPSAAVRSVRKLLLSAERQHGGALLPTGTGRNRGPPWPDEAQRAARGRSRLLWSGGDWKPMSVSVPPIHLEVSRVHRARASHRGPCRPGTGRGKGAARGRDGRHLCPESTDFFRLLP